MAASLQLSSSAVAVIRPLDDETRLSFSSRDNVRRHNRGFLELALDNQRQPKDATRGWTFGCVGISDIALSGDPLRGISGEHFVIKLQRSPRPERPYCLVVQHLSPRTSTVFSRNGQHVRLHTNQQQTLATTDVLLAGTSKIQIIFSIAFGRLSNNAFVTSLEEYLQTSERRPTVTRSSRQNLTLDPYQIARISVDGETHYASGGHAKVWKGQTASSTEVAIKVFNNAQKGREIVQNLKTFSEVFDGLAIARVYSHLTVPPRHELANKSYVIMEFTELSLSDVTLPEHGGPLTAVDVRDVFQRILQVLVQVHGHSGGYSHGYLHPENIRFRSTQRPLMPIICDAAMEPVSRGVMNMRGIRYLAPEAVNEGSLTPKSCKDIWSCGLMMLSMCVVDGQCRLFTDYYARREKGTVQTYASRVEDFVDMVDMQSDIKAGFGGLFEVAREMLRVDPMARTDAVRAHQQLLALPDEQ